MDHFTGACLHRLRYKAPNPMLEDLAAAEQLARAGRGPPTAGGDWAGDGDIVSGDSWTHFNDSSMAPIFSHDVAWMMEQEVRVQCTMYRTH